MLHNDISPSKDNLIFSSMEDLQIQSETKVEDHHHNNSLNLTKSGGGGSGKRKGHQRTPSSIERIQVIPDPEGIFQPKKQHQHNLILVQQKEQKGILRNPHKLDEDDEKIEYLEQVEESEGQIKLDVCNKGPSLVSVHDQVDLVDGRTECCNFWGIFRVSYFIIISF